MISDSSYLICDEFTAEPTEIWATEDELFVSNWDLPTDPRAPGLSILSQKEWESLENVLGPEDLALSEVAELNEDGVEKFAIIDVKKEEPVSIHIDYAANGEQDPEANLMYAHGGYQTYRWSRCLPVLTAIHDITNPKVCVFVVRRLELFEPTQLRTEEGILIFMYQVLEVCRPLLHLRVLGFFNVINRDFFTCMNAEYPSGNSRLWVSLHKLLADTLLLRGHFLDAMRKDTRETYMQISRTSDTPSSERPIYYFSDFGYTGMSCTDPEVEAIGTNGHRECNAGIECLFVQNVLALADYVDRHYCIVSGPHHPDEQH